MERRLELLASSAKVISQRVNLFERVVVTKSGGSPTQIGAAIAAQNVGALFAPIWGWTADRSLAYRAIFFNGFRDPPPTMWMNS